MLKIVKIFKNMDTYAKELICTNFMENESNSFKFKYFVFYVKLIKSPYGHKPPNSLG